MKKEYKKITVPSSDILKTIDFYCQSGWKYSSICSSIEKDKEGQNGYILIFENEKNCDHEWDYGYFYSRCIKCDLRISNISMTETDEDCDKKDNDLSSGYCSSFEVGSSGFTYKSNETKDNRAEILAKYPGYNYICKNISDEWFVWKDRPIFNRVHGFWFNESKGLKQELKRVYDDVMFDKTNLSFGESISMQSLYSKEKQKVWIKATQEHIGKEHLKIRVKNGENFEWHSLDTLHNKIYGIDLDSPSYIFKSQYSNDMYVGYKFCEVLEEK